MSGEHTTVSKCPSEYVKLNVGGSLYYTTIGTLQKQDTMLRAMFSGRMEVLTDSEGEIHCLFVCSFVRSLARSLVRLFVGLCAHRNALVKRVKLHGTVITAI